MVGTLSTLARHAALAGLWGLAAWSAIGLLGAPAAQAQPAAAASAPAAPVHAAGWIELAQADVQAGRHEAALDKLARAETLPINELERYVLWRTRAPALLALGRHAEAVATLKLALASPQMPPDERQRIGEATVKLALQAKDYPEAQKLMEQYFAAHGEASNPELRQLYPQVLSLNGDHAGAARVLLPRVAAEEAAARVPSEELLRQLASAQGQAGDQAGYLQTVVKLAATTAKPDYWREALHRTVTQPGFARERLMLDIYRLQRALGLPLDAGATGDMGYRAQQAGFPAEAMAVLEQGFASGVLGKDKNADADRKLREQATRAAAADQKAWADSEAAARRNADGNALFGLGLALSGAGQHDKALELMRAGMAKGGLRQPQDSALHYAQALWRAGRRDDAKTAFQAVQGRDGSADLARLWLAHLAAPR